MTIRDIAIAFGYKVDAQSEKKANESIDKLKSVATKTLGAIGIGFSLVGLNEIAEEFNGVNDQIRHATEGLGEQEEIQSKILEAANNAKMSYKDTAKFVGDLVQENKDLFATVEDATEYATLTSKLFMSAGKSQEEIASLQEAINKSFAKGIVDSETINQLYERAPEAINMIADSLGVAKENLAKMATDGTLSLADLKNAFVENADVINQQFDGLDYSISDALLNIRNQWGLFVDDMNGTLGITKTISKFMVRGFSTAMSGLKKALGWIQKVADRLGGVQNLIKLVAGAGAAVFLALNGGKILDFLRTAARHLGGINKQMILTQLKTLAIIAAIMLLFLVIDDIINFVKGNDSVIGTLFKKAGIDADKARETIKAAWKTITDFLLKAWEAIKKVGEKIWGALGRFWAENGEEIMDTLADVWGAIWTVLSAIWNALSDVAHSIFDALKAFWDKWGDKIKKLFSILWKNCGDQIMAFLKVVKGIAEFISGVFSGDWNKAWDGIKNIFTGILDAMLSTVNNIWSAILIVFTGSAGDAEGRMEKMKSFLSGIWEGIKNTATTVFDALKAFWEQWGAQITAQFQITWDTISGIISAFIQVAQGIIDFVVGVFTGNWEQAWQGIKGIFEGIWNAISSFFTGIWDTIHNWFGGKLTAIKDTLIAVFNGAIDYMTSLPGKALQWGKDFIDGLVAGIKGKVDDVVGAVKGIGDKIKSFLHFSVPDEGPLTDYQQWMPDFVSGLAQGIQNNAPLIYDAVQDIGKKVKSFLHLKADEDKGPLDSYQKSLPKFVSGLSNGIKQGISMANQAMRGLAKQVHLPKIQNRGSAVPKEADIPTHQANKTQNAEAPLVSLRNKLLSFKNHVSNKNPLPQTKRPDSKTHDKIDWGYAAKKLRENSIPIVESIKALSNDLSALSSTSVQPKTAAAVSGGGDRTTNVNQTNNIKNEFHGSDRAAQTQGAKAMNKSAEDVTDYLARGLAYGR